MYFFLIHQIFFTFYYNFLHSSTLWYEFFAFFSLVYNKRSNSKSVKL